MVDANFTALCFIPVELSYCRSKFHIKGMGIFYLFCFCDLDLDPMTFTYELDPYHLEIYVKAFKVIVSQTYRQTYTPPKYIRRRFAGGQ